jgi:hypothetical protein
MLSMGFWLIVIPLGLLAGDAVPRLAAWWRKRRAR